MQLRMWSALILYAASYLPLSLILLAQDFDFEGFRCTWHGIVSTSEYSRVWTLFKAPHLSLSFVGICGASMVCTLAVLAILKPKRTIDVTGATHVPVDLMNYVLPYVVSFMSIQFQDARQLVGFAIFMGWLFIITYRSGHIIMNPILIVFGWKLYDISYSFSGSNTVYSSRVLSRIAIEPNASHRVSALQDILIIKASAS